MKKKQNIKSPKREGRTITKNLKSGVKTKAVENFPALLSYDEKRKMLQSLYSAEAKLDEELLTNQEYSNLEISKHNSHLAVKYSNVLKSTFAEMKDEAAQAYVVKKSICTQEDGKAAETVRAARVNAINKRPPWVTKIVDLVFTLEQFGHSNSTTWRTKVLETLHYTQVYCEEHYGKSDFTLKISQIRRDINTFTAHSFIPVIHELVRGTEAVDLVWGARARVLRDAEEKREEANTFFLKNVKDTVSALEQQREETIQKTVDAETRKLIFQPKIKKQNAQVSIYDLENINKLHSIEKIPIGRDSIADIKNKYNTFLSECSTRGLWRQALMCYASMAQRHIPPTEKLFRLIITACKRAVPSQPTKVYDILGEMLHEGFKPSLGTFNVAVSSCVSDGKWRIAARILKLMGHVRVFANAVTYDTLLQVARNAKHKDSPEIYEAFKFAGVPEAISYACANEAKR